MLLDLPLKIRTDIIEFLMVTHDLPADTFLDELESHFLELATPWVVAGFLSGPQKPWKNFYKKSGGVSRRPDLIQRRFESTSDFLKRQISETMRRSKFVEAFLTSEADKKTYRAEVAEDLCAMKDMLARSEAAND